MSNSDNKDERFVSRWKLLETEDVGYVNIPGYILRWYHAFNGKGISPQEFTFIAHVMSFKFDIEGSVARPSLSTIAHRMGRDVRSIHRIKQSLVNKGAMNIHTRPGKPSIYSFDNLVTQCEILQNKYGDDITHDKNVTTTHDKNVIPPMTKMSYEDSEVNNNKDIEDIGSNKVATDEQPLMVDVELAERIAALIGIEGNCQDCIAYPGFYCPKCSEEIKQHKDKLQSIIDGCPTMQAHGACAARDDNEFSCLVCEWQDEQPLMADDTTNVKCEECGVILVDGNYEIDFDNQQFVCPGCYSKLAEDELPVAEENFTVACKDFAHLCLYGVIDTSKLSIAYDLFRGGYLYDTGYRPVDKCAELQYTFKLSAIGLAWCKHWLSDNAPDDTLKNSISELDYASEVYPGGDFGTCGKCGLKNVLIKDGKCIECQHVDEDEHHTIGSAATGGWGMCPDCGSWQRGICGECNQPQLTMVEADKALFGNADGGAKDGEFGGKQPVADNLRDGDLEYLIPIRDYVFGDPPISRFVRGRLQHSGYIENESLTAKGKSYIQSVAAGNQFEFQTQHYRMLAVAYIKGNVSPTNVSFISAPNLPAINQLVEDGLLRKRYSHFVLTDAGKQMCDSATGELLAAIEEQRQAAALRANGKSNPKSKSKGKKSSKDKYPDEIAPEIASLAEKMCELLYGKPYVDTTQNTRGMVVKACWEFKRAGYGVDAVQTVYDYHVSNGWKGFTPQSLLKHLDAALAITHRSSKPRQPEKVFEPEDVSDFITTED